MGDLIEAMSRAAEPGIWRWIDSYSSMPDFVAFDRERVLDKAREAAAVLWRRLIEPSPAMLDAAAAEMLTLSAESVLRRALEVFGQENGLSARPGAEPR